jgi:hypothetical protein
MLKGNFGEGDCIPVIDAVVRHLSFLTLPAFE